MPFSATWMDLDLVILSEVTQTKMMSRLIISSLENPLALQEEIALVKFIK